jgi:hypothetical protein
MFCAISGQAPEKAVVSKITGHVYEASLLEKYLTAEGKVRGARVAKARPHVLLAAPPLAVFAPPLARREGPGRQAQLACCVMWRSAR